MHLIDQQIFNVIFGLLGGLGAWLMKFLYDMMRDQQTAARELSDKVAKLEVSVAGSCITRSEFSAGTEAISRKLDQISHKLDTKADK